MLAWLENDLLWQDEWTAYISHILIKDKSIKGEILGY